MASNLKAQRLHERRWQARHAVYDRLHCPTNLKPDVPSFGPLVNVTFDARDSVAQRVQSSLGDYSLVGPRLMEEFKTVIGLVSPPPVPGPVTHSRSSAETYGVSRNLWQKFKLPEDPRDSSAVHSGSSSATRASTVPIIDLPDRGVRPNVATARQPPKMDIVENYSCFGTRMSTIKLDKLHAPMSSSSSSSSKSQTMREQDNSTKKDTMKQAPAMDTSHNSNPIIQQRKEEFKQLDELIYAKTKRTKVYAGVPKRQPPYVPTLKELCIKMSIANIAAIKYTGGIPFHVLEPVLKMATVEQLFTIEHHNPYLIQDTDNLWEYFCKRNFRSENKEESETWREMYIRCMDEREAKLKKLTANIKQNLVAKTLPQRTTKLVCVDNGAKPLRSDLPKQAKYSTARGMQNTASDSKKKLISGSGSAIKQNISVPPPSVSRARPNLSSRTSKKPKAPLMAKALKMMKRGY